MRSANHEPGTELNSMCSCLKRIILAYQVKRTWAFSPCVSHPQNLTFTQSQTPLKNTVLEEFPSGKVIRTQCFYYWGLSLIPGEGTKILQALQVKKEKRKERWEAEEQKEWYCLENGELRFPKGFNIWIGYEIRYRGRTLWIKKKSMSEGRDTELRKQHWVEWQ